MNEYSRPWNSTESADDYRKWFPVFYDHSTFDLVGFGQEAIGLPPIATLDLKKNVLAAAIASKLRISLNYAAKRYVEDFEIPTIRALGLSRRIESIFDDGRKRFCIYLDSLKTADTKNSDSFDDLANQFFYRNLAGLDAAKKLSELGYLCEVAVILRSLLEQFSFSARLRNLPSKSELHKIRPVQCLNYLKTINPSSGRLYGLLSKYTHFEFDHHTHFFGRSEDAIFTVQKDSVLRAYSTHLIFLTMLSMARYIISVAPSQIRELPPAISTMSEYARSIVAYSAEVCELLPGDSVLKQFDREVQESGRSELASDG